MWWFSGRSRRLGGVRGVLSERKQDVRVELCEKGGLRLGVRFWRLVVGRRLWGAVGLVVGVV